MPWSSFAVVGIFEGDELVALIEEPADVEEWIKLLNLLERPRGSS